MSTRVNGRAPRTTVSVIGSLVVEVRREDEEVGPVVAVEVAEELRVLEERVSRSGDGHAPDGALPAQEDADPRPLPLIQDDVRVPIAVDADAVQLQRRRGRVRGPRRRHHHEHDGSEPPRLVMCASVIRRPNRLNGQ